VAAQRLFAAIDGELGTGVVSQPCRIVARASTAPV
jgi:hypothetical protein